MTFEAFSGLAGAATIGVAALSPSADRKPALQIAGLIFLGWALYVLPWHGMGIAHWTNELGRKTGLPFGMTNGAAWAMEDSLISMAVMFLWFQYERCWMLVVWTVIVGEISIEATYDISGNGAWPACELALDSLYFMSCAVIWSVGGKGGISLLADRFHRRWPRHSFHSTLRRGSRRP